MRLKQHLFALAMMILAPSALASQQGGPPPGAAVTGVVQDGESGAALAGASVALWNARDSSLVTGAVTDDEGRFAVAGVPPGRYSLHVSYIGYASQRDQTISVEPGQARVQAGAIALQPSAVEVEGLVVEGERSAVQLTVDRTVYRAQDLPASAGGNASDALRNVPAVEVDADGRLSLRGNQNVAVQINGRATPLQGEALANFLAQIPASMLERIEVVTTPSARHDPEGMGGIINIVLQQNVQLGWSGGLNAGIGTNEQFNGSGNVGYQGGPLTLMASYGVNADRRGHDGWMVRENLYEDPVTFLDQSSEGAYDVLAHTLNLNGELALGGPHSAYASVVANRHAGDLVITNAYQVRDDPQSDFLHVADIGMEGSMLDAAIGLRRVVEPRRHELQGELRFNRNLEDRSTGFLRRASGIDSRRREGIDSDAREYSAQIDYTRPLPASLRVETGLKASLRALDSDFGEPAGASARLPEQLGYDENVGALYAQLTRPFGRTEAQAGLRVERTWTELGLAGASTSDDAYTSFFPSASLLYRFDEHGTRSLKAAYARRIQRPQVQLLNPFVFAEDPLNRFEGNPLLGPEYTDAWELTYQTSGSLGTLQATPFYRRSTDVIRRYKTVDTTGVSVTTVRNMDEADSWGMDLTGTFRLGRVSGFASVSGFQMTTDGSNVESGLASETFSWSTRLSASLDVTGSTELQFFQFYRAPLDLEQGRVSSFSTSNVALRQQFLDDRASITLRLTDPMDAMEFSFRTADANHVQETSRDFRDSRALIVSLSYSLGQQPRMQPRRREGQSSGGGMPGGDIGIN